MSIAKQLGAAAGWLIALRFRLRYTLMRRVLGPGRAFLDASEAIARVPGHLGVYARQSFYRRHLAGVGGDVYFGFMTLFSKTQTKLGHRVYVGRFCTIGWADIGEDAMIADGVQILSGGRTHLPASHDSAAASTLRDNALNFQRVTIGRGAWIGAGAIVMADVGEGAIVAAGAVVTKPVASGSRVAGVPARPLPPSVG